MKRHTTDHVSGDFWTSLVRQGCVEPWIDEAIGFWLFLVKSLIFSIVTNERARKVSALRYLSKVIHYHIFYSD